MSVTALRHRRQDVGGPSQPSGSRTGMRQMNQARIIPKMASMARCQADSISRMELPNDKTISA
jgi:hypothetical protein